MVNTCAHFTILGEGNLHSFSTIWFYTIQLFIIQLFIIIAGEKEAFNFSEPTLK